MTTSLSVAVIGGGIAGCVAALEAVRAGYGVTLYEAEALGAGASGQALGVLVPSTGTRAVDELQRQGCAAWPETLIPLLAELAGVPEGQLYRRWARGGQLNLAALFGAFEAGFARVGVQVVRQRVTAAPTGPVLWAAGWGHAALLPGMGIRAGVACRVAACGLEDLLVGSGETQGLYAVPAWDGTVLLGTESWHLEAPFTGPLPADRLASLRARAGLLHAPLAQAEVLAAWVGNRPTSSPRLPLVREVGLQQWAVAGLGGLGYALAPVVARDFLTALTSSS